jgi:plastocyanin
MAYITLSMALVVLMVGCASPNTPQTGAVHYINIGESVSPKALRAKVGDEVRWVNLGQQAVRLHIIGNMEAVVCQRGFGDLTGRRIVSTRIASQASASLCLGEAGEVKFNVQREDDDPPPTERRFITEPSGIGSPGTRVTES